MNLPSHPKVVLLDSSILTFLCHERCRQNESPRIQNLVNALAGQEIRTDSTFVSGFVMFESLGITIRRIAASKPEIFADISNSTAPISEIFKRELDQVIEILSELEALQIPQLQQKLEDHLSHQSPEGRYWLENYLGFHVRQFTEDRRQNLIRRIATEIVIGRNFVGFDPEELGKQFAVLYITGIVHEDSALASPRALDKVIAALTRKNPNMLLSDVNLTVKAFQNAQKYRPKEELLDVEMIQHLIFGHHSERHGSRPVVAFTCEDPDAIEARISAACGFVVAYREVHETAFLPGEIYCLDRTNLNVLRHFKTTEFIQRYSHLESRT